LLKWFLIILIFMGATGAAGFYYVWPRFKPKPLEWKTEKVGRGDIVMMVTSTGTVNPVRTVLVGSQISGRVKEVNKVTNDLIKKGDVLASLDTDLLESEKRSAEVRWGQMRAGLSLLKVERENLQLRELRQKSAVDSKKISAARAKGTLDLASKNRQRSQDLLKVDATSQTELDIRVLEEANSLHDFHLAEIQVEQLEIDTKQIAADGRQLDAKEEQARADIQNAEAVIARAKTNLSYATIISPIDGVVLQHLVEPGQTIAASFQTPNMFKLASDLSQVRIDAQLDEADIGKIRTGQEVSFDVDAYRGETFTGNVVMVKIQSETKGNLVTYPVLVEAKNPPDKDHPSGKLLPGMTAGLKLVVDQHKNVLRLPSAALRFIAPPGSAPPVPSKKKSAEDKKSGTLGTVYVAAPLGKLDPKQVRVGENDGEFFELLDGEIKDGDDVVTGIKIN